MNLAMIMKQILSTLIFILFFYANLTAQTFDDAMDLYNNEQYEEAAELFVQTDDDRAQLFAGKSYLALSEYTEANTYLYRALEIGPESLQHEALFTLALSHFELKNYERSLQYLYKLAESTNRSGLRSDARRFYNQILNYLSASERFEILYRLESPGVRFDLVKSSSNFLDSDTFDIMVSELLKMTTGQSEINRIENDLLAGTELRPLRNQYPTAPEGTIYNLGVILPEFDEEDPDFTIPRNLYFGMLVAADDFNSRNINQKVKLTFRNSHEDPDSTAKALTELAWVKKVDAVIGPLFSEPASRMAELSEEYRVPMLAPLANADDLNRDYNYLFQLNPTFETHGRVMARHAVQNLRLNNIAIFLEEGEISRSSALAFRREAERLGANITYFIEEDFEARGYDLSEAIEVFTRDAALIDSLNITRSQAIYAPFTGQASTTMMNLLLTELEAMQSNPVILGSEEWEHYSLTDYQQRFFEIYYSQPFHETTNTAASDFFEEDYESRFGSSPDLFSRVGYDAATFLFQNLETAGNPLYLSRAMRTAPVHNGLAVRIHFNGQRINQSPFIRPLSDRARER
jgi:ABC-type branched-subunit amino acid transport system substrate-binding protein